MFSSFYKKRLFIGTLVAGCLLGSCKKEISELQNNTNVPQEVPAKLILGNVLNSMAGMGTNGTLGGVASWGSVHKYNQYFLGAYAYYGDNQYSWSSGSFDSYLLMKNVNQMNKEAIRQSMDSSLNVFASIGKFVNCWYLYNLTSLMGDVPMTDALKGIDNMTPAYSTQKEVFVYILNQLETLNANFATLIANADATISGSNQDIYYAGDLTKWQKAVNTFALRVLISLSKKTADTDLNIAKRFANIVNNPTTYPIMTSQDDDLKYTYINPYNIYPLNQANFGSTASRYAMSKTYVSLLTSLKDPRVYVTCEPAWSLVENKGYSPLDFNAFVGESTGVSIATIEQEASARVISFINRQRYYTSNVGDPDVLLGYKEMCFNLAEGLNRAWASGDAATWYKKGIQESFNFYGLTVTDTSFKAYFLQSGGLTNIKAYPFTFNFNSYYNQSNVSYESGANGIAKIVQQKYLAMFQNSGYEAYYNYRRTGFPTFLTGTGIGNNGNIPTRWAYPSTEQSINSANWKAALANQGFSSDDINGTLWLVK